MNSISRYFFLLFILASSQSIAAPAGDCSGTPADAVIELPAPLATWAQITCTPYGHVIESQTGWVWSKPGSYAPVFMPSQMVRDNPEKVGNKSYFTKIALSKVAGDEFTKAYEAFHQDMGVDTILPAGYRLDLISVSGKTIIQYFFDYGDFAWGIWCNKICDPDTRFMLLNMKKQPNG